MHIMYLSSTNANAKKTRIGVTMQPTSPRARVSLGKTLSRSDSNESLVVGVIMIMIKQIWN